MIDEDEFTVENFQQCTTTRQAEVETFLGTTAANVNPGNLESSVVVFEMALDSGYADLVIHNMEVFIGGVSDATEVSNPFVRDEMRMRVMTLANAAAAIMESRFKFFDNLTAN